MSEKPTLEVLRLHEDVELPEYAYPGDAGLDLRAAENVTLAPFERKLIPTGISVAIPEGYAGFVVPRSGMALKRGLSLVNTPGIIDSGYRGELKCIAINLDAHTEIEIAKGERIAQLLLVQTPQAHVLEVSELSETQRGEGGFGSSGTQ